MSKLLAIVRDNAAIQFALLMAFALVLNREGNSVPGGNEQVYLLYLVKAWHAKFMASDWTFQEPTAGHPVFNMLFGWPTLFVSVETLGWIGRLASWAAIFAALTRIGRHFRIPSWIVSTGILLWLVQRQSFVSNEWMIGTFEAKCAAYACLLWAIDFVLRGRVIFPAILTGLAFTFHSAVGLWGGAAVSLAFVSLNPIRTTFKFIAWAALAALPGAITTLQLVFGGHAISPDEARYLVVSEMPFHLDPFTFGASKIAVMYLMLLFNWMQARGEMLHDERGTIAGSAVWLGAFRSALLGAMGKRTRLPVEPVADLGTHGQVNTLAHGTQKLQDSPRTVVSDPRNSVRSADPTTFVTALSRHPERSEGSLPLGAEEIPSASSGQALRCAQDDTHLRERTLAAEHPTSAVQCAFFIRFQLVTGAFFAAGIAFRLLGKFSLVELFPFRVFAVTVMLFFFWHLAAAYWHRQRCRPSLAMTALGILMFLCLPSPVARLQGLAADQLPKWRRGDDDFRAAAKWVRDHAPQDAVVIAPPWRKDGFFFTQHPLVADWHAPRYDAMTEWRQRVESLVGDVSRMNVEDNLAGEMDLRARDHYASLSPADLSAIARRYGGDLLITEGRYDYPQLFRSGSYNVYKLEPAKDDRLNDTASVGP